MITKVEFFDTALNPAYDKECIAVSSFRFTVDQTTGKPIQLVLNIAIDSYAGQTTDKDFPVYIPAGTWRTITNYSTNAVAVIAASTHYALQDAIRDYDEFSFWVTNERVNELKNEGFNEASSNLQSPITNRRYSVYDCGIVTLDRHHSQRKGDISVIENGETIPFDVKRIYYLYDVPGGESRGSHGHKQLEQLIIAVSGAFTVTLDDGNVRRSFTLNRPYQGLLVKPGIWSTLDDFSSGSVCLVLASEKYKAEDYIRDYNDFIEYRKQL